MDYRAAAKVLTIEYLCPTADDLPRMESVKYSRTKGEFIESDISKRDFEHLYGDVIFQIAIRTAHELFQADAVRALDAVVFNVVVHVTNPGTGHREARCLASMRAPRDIFDAVNLRKIEPRA